MDIIKNVALFLRISRDKGEDVDTLQNHRDRLIRLCDERGYTYTLFEEILSGQSEFDNRVKLNEMLDRLNEFDAVVCVAIDRLSRDLEYSIRIYKLFEKAGIPIITPEKTYTEKDFTLFAIESTIAHGEYKLIRKRMMEGKRDKAMRGEIVNGLAPRGYDAVIIDKKRTYVPNQDAPSVKQMFDLCVNGYGGRAISEIMGMALKSVDWILRNEVYCGKAIYDGIVVPNAFTALISQDTYDKAQEAMRGRYAGSREARTRNRGKITSIMKNLIYCGGCGRKIMFQHSHVDRGQILLLMRKCECGMQGVKEETVRIEFYKQMEDIEEQLREKWTTVLDTPTVVTKDAIEIQIQEHLRRKDKLTKRMKTANEMRLDEEISKAEFKEMKTSIEADLVSVNKVVIELQNKLNHLDTVKLGKEYEHKLDLIGRFRALETPPAKGEMVVRTAPVIENLDEANRLLSLLIDKIYYERNGDDMKVIVAPK